MFACSSSVQPSQVAANILNHLQVTKWQIMNVDHRFLSLALPEHGRSMSAEGHRWKRQANLGTSRGHGYSSFSDGWSFLPAVGNKCHFHCDFEPLDHRSPANLTTLALHYQHHLPPHPPTPGVCADCQTGQPSQPLVATVSCQPGALTAILAAMVPSSHSPGVFGMLTLLTDLACKTGP